MSLSNSMLADQKAWLRSYCFIRAAVSIGWILLAVSVGRGQPVVAGLLLALYPAWDAVANYIDARQAGGLRSNPTQSFNLVVSAITAGLVVGALLTQAYPVLIVFGAWAALAGVLQLATGVRRWRTGGQWAMVLSGAQSVIAGAFFVTKASIVAPDLAAVAVAPYAGFGAFYFLVSGVWLLVQARLQARRVTEFDA